MAEDDRSFELWLVDNRDGIQAEVDEADRWLDRECKRYKASGGEQSFETFMAHINHLRDTDPEAKRLFDTLTIWKILLDEAMLLLPRTLPARCDGHDQRGITATARAQAQRLRTVRIIIGAPRRVKRRRGRPSVSIENDPQRYEIACWWAFTEIGTREVRRCSPRVAGNQGRTD